MAIEIVDYNGDFFVICPFEIVFHRFLGAVYPGFGTKPVLQLIPRGGRGATYRRGHPENWCVSRRVAGWVAGMTVVVVMIHGSFPKIPDLFGTSKIKRQPISGSLEALMETGGLIGSTSFAKTTPAFKPTKKSLESTFSPLFPAVLINRTVDSSLAEVNCRFRCVFIGWWVFPEIFCFLRSSLCSHIFPMLRSLENVALSCFPWPSWSCFQPP